MIANCYSYISQQQVIRRQSAYLDYLPVLNAGNNSDISK
ncbi:MAG: hypothetical protein OFPI_18700 [Osedax symbiont Rs2]|nr:MAG: hypothetical protein OFPI_18700 [Osedax symbiont Rs2]